MSHERDAGLLPDEESLNPDESSVDMDRMTSIEKTLETLIEGGILKVPHMFSFDRQKQPSDETRLIGARVQVKVLERLGVPTLGSYIKSERERKGLDKQVVASQLELASTSLTDIERDRLNFFDLTVQKAADITEVIGLNVPVILAYLRATMLLTPAHQRGEVSRLYRTRLDSVQEKRSHPKDSAQQGDVIADTTAQRIGKFMDAFLSETTRRGLVRDNR